MGIVGRRRYTDGTGAADVRVAQLVRQALQLVRVKVIVVPQNVVMRGATGALDALMAAQIEIEFGGMCDAHIDGGACGNIARFAALLLFLGAE